jgi:hypothetical protein
MQMFKRLIYIGVTGLFAVQFASAQPHISDNKLRGVLNRIVQTYEIQGEASALDQAKVYGLKIRKKGQESCIPLIIEPKSNVLARDFDRSWLTSRGITIDAASRSYIRVLVPLRLARLLSQHPQINAINVPIKPIAFAGLGPNVSESVALTLDSTLYRQGYNGSGQKVAVVDMGFYGLQAAIDHGEIPSGTVKIKLPGSGSIDTVTAANHGTVVVEQLMDMAPACTPYCIMVSDVADLQNAADTILAKGIRVVNHSVGWTLMGYYNDSGTVDSIVNALHDNNNVFWSVAGGNEAKRHWRGSWTDNNSNNLLDFPSNKDSMQIINIDGGADGQSAAIYLNWNQYPKATTDFDLYVYNKSGVLADSSTFRQIDDTDPWYYPLPQEWIEFPFYAANAPYRIKVKWHSGPKPAGLDLTLFTPGTDINNPIDTCSIMNPADAHGAFTVASVNQATWLQAKPPINSFSSQGPTTDGRMKPDITGPDYTTSYTWGTQGAVGTSFSAPIVAGAAAILIQMYPSITANAIADTLKALAKHISASHSDSLKYGAGLLYVYLPPPPTGAVGQTFCAISSPTVASLSAIGSNIQWYGASTGGSPLSTSTALVNATTYYASQTMSARESASRLAVTVTVSNPAAPTGSASQTFCAIASPTIANLAAAGTGIQWYSTASGGSQLSTSTALVNAATYYASQTESGCESSSRLAVSVAIASLPTPTLSSPSDGAIDQATTVRVSWDSAGTGITFRVQVATDLSFTTIIADDSTLADTSNLLTGLLQATTYYWHVNIKGACGVGPWSSTRHFVTIPPVSAAPVLVSPVNGAAGLPVSMTLLWNRSIGASVYYVNVATDTGFTVIVKTDSTLTAADTSKSLAGLLENTAYVWRVNAKNAGGIGPWSASGKFSTAKRFLGPVNRGWNMVSLNIHPNDSTSAGVFGPLKGFILAKNNAGQVYWPAQTIDDIHSISTGQGYQVYTDSLDTMRALGPVTDVSASPLSLPAGWSMIAYLPQSDMSIAAALSGVTSQILIVKNNAGQIYWPDYSINDIGTMKAGQGYKVCMKSPAVLSYPYTGAAKLRSGSHEIITVVPRHFICTLNTGSSAAVLAKRILINGIAASDNCEIGAFNAKGTLVGAGVVIKGSSAFCVWGKDPQSGEKIGCNGSEKINFLVWDQKHEYALEMEPSADVRYATDGIFTGAFAVPQRFFIKKFDLTKAYPNPFRGRISILFDVPTTEGIDKHEVLIAIYSVKGELARQVVKGKYSAGHYSVLWNGTGDNDAKLGSNVFIVEMKASGFNKRIKLFKIR